MGWMANLDWVMRTKSIKEGGHMECLDIVERGHFAMESQSLLEKFWQSLFWSEVV